MARSLDPTLPLPRAEAIRDEIAARRAAHLLLHRLLEAGEPRLGHADGDVVLQLGSARALALSLLPARAPLVLGGGRATLFWILGAGCGRRSLLSGRHAQGAQENGRGSGDDKHAHGIFPS